MAEVLVPTTRLSAVNSILASIGEPPTVTLDAPIGANAINAEATLNETSRMVQGKGWYFNREELVTLTADGSGFISLAANVVRARVSDRARTWQTRDWIYRNQRLYDRKNRTYVFTVGQTIQVDQIVLHPFEELPEPAREYIWARAGVTFQNRYAGGELLFRFTEGLASAGWAAMVADELEHERYNLDDSGALRDLVYRR
jgi:hypothetical protein